MINLGSLNSGHLFKVLAVLLSVVWSTTALPFYTVHKLNNLKLVIHFQSGLSDISTETINKKDMLRELSGGRPGNNDIVAAIIDCNNPGSVYLVVWDKNNQSIVAESSMITLIAVETVIRRKNKKDFIIALLDTEALFGSGYITARMRISKIRDKLIPPEATPEDETYCVSKLEGLSAAGFVEGDSSGIVSGGRIEFGKPIATLNDF